MEGYAALLSEPAHPQHSVIAHGADRISEGGVTLYNPAKMQVRRYRYRGAQICTPYNLDDVDPAGALFRQTSHNDEAFVGRVSELVSPT